MTKGKKILTISTIAVVLAAVFSSALTYSPAMAQPPPNATLTGRIFDSGSDTDSDGLFNFLVVQVEVSVLVDNMYTVSIDSLRDAYYGYVAIRGDNKTYLTAGNQNVTVLLNGIAIYASKLRPTHVCYVSLSYSEGSVSYRFILPEIPLSATYSYTLFDTGATIIGILHDQGIDTDGDDLFNFLQVEVEINVTDEAVYGVTVFCLVDVSGPSYKYAYVSNRTESFLSAGAQTLSVWLYGPSIYPSHASSLSKVQSIQLELCLGWSYYGLHWIGYTDLSRAYGYDEFDTIAYFVQPIFGEGIDEDGDFRFESLRIGVNINVTEAGHYYVMLQDLVDNFSNHIYVYETASGDFDAGVHCVNITVYGPSIYMSHVDPSRVGTITLAGNIKLDTLANVPLSVAYGYSDFESLAQFTGNTSDMGVDTDLDGLYDYLAVGFEINVTEAGKYAVNVERLTGRWKNSTDFLYAYQRIETDLTVGLHFIYANFSGPMIVYSHFNPANVTSVALSQTAYPYLQLGYVQEVPLSREYNYTEFNAPLNDMEIEFKVYPNATLDVRGSSDYRHMYQPYEQPKLNATLAFSTVDNQTAVSANGTFAFPESQRHRWPFDSANGSLLIQYQDDMLDAQLDAAIVMPPEAGYSRPINSSSLDLTLTAGYSDGIVSVNLAGIGQLCPEVAQQFPFNISDLRAVVDYADKEFVGNVTFRTVAGFPLGDVIANFRGNETQVSLYGYINVIYGIYSGMEFNETNVEDLRYSITSSLSGRGERSLYEMTQGLLECTSLNTTSTAFGPPDGTRIDYNATINGNFTSIIAKMITNVLTGGHGEGESTVYAALKSAFSSVQNGSLRMNFYNASKMFDFDLVLRSDVKELWSNAVQLVPSTVPVANQTMVYSWMRIANATAYAVDSAHFDAVYSRITQKLDLTGSLTANLTQLKGDIRQFIPDAVPLSMHDAVEGYLNVTYAELDSSRVSCNLTGGIAEFSADLVFSGDFNAQVNHGKSILMNYLNINRQPIDWSMSWLNATDINISNCHVELRQGSDWTTMAIDGVRFYPNEDAVDFIRFKLARWLDLTSDPYASPREFEKLKIAVVAGFNGTHTVLFEAPGGVPSPNATGLDYKAMTWENVSMSSLRNMLFKVAYQGVVDHVGRTFYVPVFTNSTVSSFGFNAAARRISFNAAGTSGMGFCNITIPKALLYAAPDDWVIRINGTTLNPGQFNVTENAEYVFLYLNYTHSGHLIEVEGTWVVTEFPTMTLILALATSGLIATAFVFKKRKRLGTLTMKYHSAVYAFLKRHALRS